MGTSALILVTGRGPDGPETAPGTGAKFLPTYQDEGTATVTTATTSTDMPG